MRETLSSEKITPEALNAMETFHSGILKEVKETIWNNKYVIVGMAQNPHVVKARKIFAKKGLDYKYLEYGGYFSMWKPRLAIKLWSGWPTFPQVYINGQLIGGCADLEKYIQDGKLV